MKYVSTSMLARQHNINNKLLFTRFREYGWIERRNDLWELTDIGKELGGQLRYTKLGKQFIVWPDNLNIENETHPPLVRLLTIEIIAKHFKTSPNRLNLILVELGWLENTISGWRVSRLGRKIGGKTFADDVTGITYTLWEPSILENTHLISLFDLPTEIDFSLLLINNESKTDESSTSSLQFRKRYKTKDGHIVRTHAEVIIDNALYDYNLAHSYRRKVTINEDFYSDFYLPTGNIHIEYIGREHDSVSLQKKLEKLNIYRQHRLKLIILDEVDILHIDVCLPRKLLKMGIKVF